MVERDRKYNQMTSYGDNRKVDAANVNIRKLSAELKRTEKEVERAARIAPLSS